ncbi:hypothetical protein AMECASPLE_038975 [Ameca splendens]|uniref:Uncharacterized protein n=1 Tax=Ameca splendens TaxID=208324 RepID=A0ABV0ZHT0_9TELE
MKDFSFCPPTTLHVTVTTVMGSLLSSFQTGRRSARLHRDRFSLGNFSGTVCFCRPQRETKRHQCACLPYPVPLKAVWKKLACWRGRALIQAVASWEVRCYPPFLSCWKNLRKMMENTAKRRQWRT